VRRRWEILTLIALLIASGTVWAVFAEDHHGSTSGTSSNTGTTTSAWTLVGWNDLGMHCMDGNDFSIASVLPPFNTIHAQLIDSTGKLVKSGSGITVTYQGVADATGSINTTSQAKTNFWTYVKALFNLSVAPDTGLTGSKMPGTKNTPQPMKFDPAHNWFTAEGIPMTPYDNAGNKNYYPMMRLVAKNSSGTVLATTDIVLPVSDEMTCSACHASGSDAFAKPSKGWSTESNPAKQVKLNILRLHDDRQPPSTIASVLNQAGYNAAGLEATATGGTPVFCARCHPSNAVAPLGVNGLPGVSQLTHAMHSHHTNVIDITNGMTLGQSEDRSACYRCHPGAATKCLRGAMGKAVAADGTMEIQCQNCHGTMAVVADPSRQGWLDEPNCQACHTGTAANNSGQIRYTSVFDSTGQMRVPANTTYATNPDTPSSGLSLYRFSSGHGGLQCEACHGSTHAEYPSSHPNDNVQSINLQGHVGMLVECASCHKGSVPSTVTGGPHGMHPVGQSWVSGHQGAAEHNRTQCQACHGTDYRGTVLSRVQADRTISAFGTKVFWRGFQVGCYTCHNGPSSEDGTSNHPPVVSNASATTTMGQEVSIPLKATDADGNTLTLRIVSQPTHGTAGLSGTTATYFPEAGFTGTDTFTFAAWDGSTNSNLGTVTITVK